MVLRLVHPVVGSSHSTTISFKVTILTECYRDVRFVSDHSNRFLVWGQAVGWSSPKAGHGVWKKLLIHRWGIYNLILWFEQEGQLQDEKHHVDRGENSRAQKRLTEEFSLVQPPVRDTGKRIETVNSPAADTQLISKKKKTQTKNTPPKKTGDKKSKEKKPKKTYILN